MPSRPLLRFAAQPGWGVVIHPVFLRLYDPEGTAHTPGTIQAWHWTRQELQAWRARENAALPEDLPENVKPLPNRQRAAELTKETHRRINQKSDK